ncbi:MAG: DNA polymerase [Patescibacteria group bacterium]
MVKKTAISLPENYKARLVILDTHAILHRAYHALPDLTDSAGQPSGALYGLIAILIKLIGELQPDYIIAAYDRPEETFRKQIYGEYKAGRAKTDDSLINQINRSVEVLEAFGVKIYSAAGFEADDIIGTIIKQCLKTKTLQTVIVSGDLDTLQLVLDDQVVVYTMRKGIKDTVLYNEKEVINRFGFKPDKLPDYKGLRGDPSDNIIGIAGIGEKTATDLVIKFGSMENLYTVLNKNPQELEKQGFKPRVIKLLTEGEEEALFSKTLAEIRKDAPINFVLPESKWLIDDNSLTAETKMANLGFRSLIERWRSLTAKEFSQDTQINVPEKEWPSLKIATWLLCSDLTDPSAEDVFRLAETSIWPDVKNNLEKKLQDFDLLKIYKDIELPLYPIIQKAVERGFLINVEHFQKLKKKYKQKLNKAETKIYKLIGREFNISSPKQLGEILFQDLGLSKKGLKKTAGGNQSTRESELIKLKDEHPVIPLILEYRGLFKILTTYVEAILELTDKNNCLHTHLHQTGTTTGRFSSTNPNLQNIPVGEEYGQDIRQGFIARPGFVFLSADYSQIELRIMAVLAKDQDLKNVFVQNQDIHTSVASRVFKVEPEAVTKEMRRQAKVINFGIIYGMGIRALKDNLGVGIEEAKIFYEQYFKSFPQIKKYIEGTITEVATKGFTETLYGRKRFLPEINSSVPFIKASAERQAINAAIQGTTADLIKIATINIDRELKRLELDDKCFFLLQIHDELIYEIKETAYKKVEAIVKNTMESVWKEELPLKVDISFGSTWADLI